METRKLRVASSGHADTADVPNASVSSFETFDSVSVHPWLADGRFSTDRYVDPEDATLTLTFRAADDGRNLHTSSTFTLGQAIALRTELTKAIREARRVAATL